MEKRIYVWLLIFAICLCSCTQSNDINNPFENYNGEQVLAQFGHGIVIDSPENEIYYAGDELELPYRFIGGNVDSETGLFLFVDGIPQRFRFGSQNDNTYMKVVNIPKNKVVDYTVFYTPDFFIDKNASLVFGTLSSSPVISDSTDVRSPNFVNTIFASVPFLLKPQNASIETGYTEKKPFTNFSTVSSNELHQNSAMRIDIINKKNDAKESIPPNGTLDFQVNMYGGDESIYRTTFFINHIPIQINECDYIECSVTPQLTTVINAKLDVSDFQLEDKNVVYAISVSMRPEDQLILYKSNNIILN